MLPLDLGGAAPGGTIRVHVLGQGVYSGVDLNLKLYLIISFPTNTMSWKGFHPLSWISEIKLSRKKFVFSLIMTTHSTAGYLDRKAAQGSTER